MESYESKKIGKEEKIQNKAYNQYVKEKMPKSKTFACCVRAFLVGGTICAVGQIILGCAKRYLDMDPKAAGGFTSVILILVGATLTGLGVYDVIGKFAGAGSIVPITGFANSIVSPAMEHKREGIIMGVGANLFKLAGPVLVAGISTAAVYGIVLCILQAMGVPA